MKKIVSALMISALAVGSLFAADISIEYNTKGYVYSEEKTKDSNGKVMSSTKTVLDQSGYDGASSDFVLSAESDVGGFVLDVDPDAASKSQSLDYYYGWVNFSNIQVTVGKWKSRYVNRVNQDSGNWADADFERYKPGVVGGKLANDIDNLTLNGGKQTLSTAVAYTLRPSDATYFMVKGVLVDGRWGGFFMNSDSGNYDNTLESGLAGEIAFRQDGLLNINLAVRSLQRDELGLGLFVSPLVSDSAQLLFGVSGGFDLADYGDGIDHNYRELGIDFRARFALSEKLAITTMNNFSFLQDARFDDDVDNYSWKGWDMVSVAYNLTDRALLQVTGEAEYGIKAGKDGATYDVGDLGGFDLSIIPGVTYSFNENASFTAGVKFSWTGVGASSSYENNNSSTTSFSIPFVFDVAL